MDQLIVKEHAAAQLYFFKNTTMFCLHDICKKAKSKHTLFKNLNLSVIEKVHAISVN